jgi:ketosteroid isomerase-like protein
VLRTGIHQLRRRRFEKTRVYIAANHFVSEYEMSGSSDGKSFSCDGVDVIAVIDGRVAREDAYLDWPQVNGSAPKKP